MLLDFSVGRWRLKTGGKLGAVVDRAIDVVIMN